MLGLVCLMPDQVSNRLWLAWLGVSPVCHRASAKDELGPLVELTSCRKEEYETQQKVWFRMTKKGYQILRNICYLYLETFDSRVDVQVCIIDVFTSPHDNIELVIGLVAKHDSNVVWRVTFLYIHCTNVVHRTVASTAYTKKNIVYLSSLVWKSF